MAAFTLSSLLSLTLCSLTASSGVIDPEWTLYGPFPTGKSELDALLALSSTPTSTTCDALIYLTRNSSSLASCSELLPSCAVTPVSLHSSPTGEVGYTPPVNFNSLIQGLSRLEVSEFTALAWTTVSVTAAARFKLHCAGVVAYYLLEPTRLELGDIYRAAGRGAGVTSYTTLTPGRRELVVLLRGKGSVGWACSVTPVARREARLQLTAVHVAPDVWAGRVLGDVLSLRVVNPTTLTLRRVTCEVVATGTNTTLHGAGQVGATVAPGVTSLLPCSLTRDEVQVACNAGGRLALQVRLLYESATSTGNATAWLQHELECRSLAQSALFTFVDHDGSVASAGVLAPLPPRRGRQPLPPVAVHDATDAAYGVPVILSMHGTGVAPRAHADSYKYKAKASEKEYTFGVEGMYVLTPSRHGAHNWQGLGLWTVRHSLPAWKRMLTWLRPQRDAACASPRASLACLPDVDDLRVLWMGHSMGGAGAWLALATYADIAIAAAPLAGWTVKEAYGDSNTYMSLDVQEPRIDTRLKGVLLNTVQDQRADVALDGVRGIPLHVRVGADDMTTHPWYSRRMLRMAMDVAMSSVEEVPGQAHWWWDTKTANDGGVMNDGKMRAFYATARQRLSSAAVWRHLRAGGTADGVQHNMQQSFEVVCMNPASCGPGRAGVGIIALHTMSRAGRASVLACDAGPVHVWHIDTSNVARLRLGYAGGIGRVSGAVSGSGDAPVALSRALCDQPSEPCVYGGAALPQLACVDGAPIAMAADAAVEVCMSVDGSWAHCAVNVHVDAGAAAVGDVTSPVIPRGGPMRAVTSRPFHIIIPAGANASSPLYSVATLLAHAHLQAFDTTVQVLREDAAASSVNGGTHNAIILSAAVASRLRYAALINVSHTCVSIAAQRWGQAAHIDVCGRGAAVLARVHALDDDTGQALVVDAVDEEGWLNIGRLALPTIPPMVRAPFVNLFPDVFVVSGSVARDGMESTRVAAYWDASTGAIDEEASYIVLKRQTVRRQAREK